MINANKVFGEFCGFSRPALPRSGSIRSLTFDELEWPPHKSARSLTVEMTVDAVMSKQKARFYAGFQPLEMIEWE